MKNIFFIAILSLAQQSFSQDTTKSASPLTVSGYVEAYYSYDFNKPIDNNRPAFLYSHNRHNEFNANLAFIKA
ncbi:MAG TPA: outer membrane beta-barrel protein, partial [Chitinophagaceae bacterium]|nr:outer membrane beta-barrel protein [Chitinophagaceae bacterium]